MTKKNQLLFLIGLFLSSGAFATESKTEVQFLQELVSISSDSVDVEGVNKVQEKMEKEFKEIGFAVELLENSDISKHSGKMLVAIKKGTDPRYITFVGHADTVFQKLNPFQDSDKEIIKGSGVADDKGGLVVGLYALRQFLKENQSKFSLRFVISPSEEIGSQGFHDKFTEYSKDSILVVGLEPARENGSFVTSRKGARWYHIHVVGHETHAGVNHDSGVNACQELAIKVNELENLTDYEKGTTVNIGHIEGGKDKYNIVCGFADAKIDVRFTDLKQSIKFFDKFEKILKRPIVHSHKTGEFAKTEFEVTDETPPLSAAVKSGPLVKAYTNILAEVEGKPSLGESTGGAADLNYMERTDLTLDGMGPIGGGYHTSEEFVKKDSLVSRATALAKFLKWFNEGH